MKSVGKSQETIVYLGLGSNLGNRQENLETALALLADKITVVKVSSVFDTAPVSNVDQPRFLNQACEVHTALTPVKLLSLLKGIENRMGRTTCGPDAPRPIDIDILFYGDLVMDTPRLTIPHPRLTGRAFVLVPLVEIAPDLVHPQNGLTIRQMFNQVDGKDSVILWKGS